MPLCDGGLLLLDIDDTYFEHLPFDQKKDALKNIAKSVLDNRHSVLTVIISDNYESESYKLIHSELTEIAFVDLVEERLGFNDAKNYLYELVSRIDKSNNIADSLLDKNKSFYSVMEIKDIFNSWRNKHILLSTYSQYNGLSPYQQKVEEPLVKGTAYKQFQSLVGLDDIKSLVDQILMAHEAHKIYLTYGINPEPTNMHMLFMGDPGTAKTTTARLIAQIFKDNSILSVGNLIEVDRSQIIERYVGWTAKNVKSLFAKAKGSILFIDEAYSLLDNTLGSYGDEAINAIVQEMENSREDTIVIFAGYTKEMTDFINKNPGLKSRVNYTVQFKNYCVEELVQIAKSIINNMGFNVAESALELCKHLFRKESSDINFGNGRYVRNVVEKAIVNHGCRIGRDSDDLDKETVITLQPEDFEPLLYKNTLYTNEQSKTLS
jgi:Holliday junction resolvasome RuvABC ATP-dependent DNA helicase subunit